MRRSFVVFLTIVMFLMVAQIAEGREKLEIYVENDAAPWSKADGTGYANDLVKAIYDAVDVDVDFEVVPYARCKKYTETGEAVGCFNVAKIPEVENKITWNGEVLAESSVSLTFEVIVNSSLENGALISNQGAVYWDSNENGTNDKTELTDDPHVDDGVDQDGDGDTNDDDPTDLYVVVFEPPPTVTEDFSDDIAGEKATQSYLGRDWFETSSGTVGSIFEVVSGYHRFTDNSFKTKLRCPGSYQYWNYSLSELESDIKWWEICFKCGNASEESNLYLDLKNDADSDIAKIKFEYVHMGTESPTDWVLELYYFNPDNGWNRLCSDFSGGYLYNSWYKLRIEKNDFGRMTYSLNRTGIGMVDSETGTLLNTFSDLTSVKWSSTNIPIVCPMFFWDEHKLGLINE